MHEASYVLELKRTHKLQPYLLAGMIAFFVATQLATTSTAPWFVELVAFGGVAYAIYFMWRILRGPKRIAVLPTGEACLKNFLGQKRRLDLARIERLEVRANRLILELNDEKILGLSGYDGLDRLVSDVEDRNPSVVTRGI